MTLTLHRKAECPIRSISVSAYEIPTDAPEGDGTFLWKSTVLVLVEVDAGDCHGVGYTYADVSTAVFIRAHLIPLLLETDAMNVNARWESMVRAIRNLGRPGIASMAIAAVDISLWDLKAKLLDVSLAHLWGSTRDRVPAYGSGGFTTYTEERLETQLGDWARDGFKRVKMKIGAHPESDERRVRAVREAIGSDVELFVDANGAYNRHQAAEFAQRLEPLGVTWFEEPVSSDDLEGLCQIRETAPAGMSVAAGEYGYDLAYFQRMISAGAVDVMQADVSRCAGFTEFLRVASLCEAARIPLSTHCAPSLHLPLGCSLQTVCHLEYFHDHVRIESMFFDGVATAKDGHLCADLSRPGLGIAVKHPDIQQFHVAI